MMMVSAKDHDHWIVINEITSPWLLLRKKIKMYKIRGKSIEIG